MNSKKNIGSDDVLKEMLQSSSSHPEQSKFTQEETETFKAAFKDPEFRNMFSGYVDRMQQDADDDEDGGHKEHAVPAGKQLIRPVSGFVAKTHMIANGKKGAKVFINVVSCDLIDAPVKQDTDEGQTWSLPYSLGSAHTHTESNKNEKGSGAAVEVTSYDCCFHPSALVRCKQSKPFRELVVATAIDGLEHELLLNKDFHVLKGVSYKAGDVRSMIIDVEKSRTEWTGRSGANSGDGNNNGRKTSDVVTSSATATTAVGVTKPVVGTANKTPSPASKVTSPTKASTSPAMKKGFLNKAVSPKKATHEKAGAPSTTNPPSSLSPPDKVCTAPGAATAVHKELLDGPMSTSPPPGMPSPVSQETSEDPRHPRFTMLANGTLEGFPDRPAELIYRFDLPRVSKASQIILDVFEKEIRLDYFDIYSVCVQLPYVVVDALGRAKYEKDKKCLVVTVPVKAVPLEVRGSDGSGGQWCVDKPRDIAKAAIPATAPPPAPMSAAKKESNKMSQMLKDKIGVKHPSASPAGPTPQTGLPPGLSLDTDPPSSLNTSQSSAADAVSPSTKPTAVTPTKKVAEKVTTPTKKVAEKVTTPTKKVAEKVVLEPFKYDIQQNNDSYAILVQVPKVVNSSVKVVYRLCNEGGAVQGVGVDVTGEGVWVDVIFDAFGLPSGDSAAHTTGLCAHGLSLLIPCALDIAKCKHYVADKNMLLALLKPEGQERLVQQKVKSSPLYSNSSSASAVSSG